MALIESDLETNLILISGSAVTTRIVDTAEIELKDEE